MEGEVDHSGASRVGREDRYSSVSATSPSRRRKEDGSRHEEFEENFTVYAEDDAPRGDRQSRVSRRREEATVYEGESRHSHAGGDHVLNVDISRDRRREDHEPHRHYAESHIEVDRPSRTRTETHIDIERRPGSHAEAHIEVDRHPIAHSDAHLGPGRSHGHRSHLAESEIDVTEREYRRRVHHGPTVHFEDDFQPEHHQHHHHRSTHVGATVELPDHHRSKMGYYDDDGHYHSFRQGFERGVDRLLHPHHHRSTVREEVHLDDEFDRPRPSRAVRESVRVVERGRPPNTITIPCHHIRLGDLLILQGRPCQVIRITISNQTGQYRYLGVDLFTKQLHEESSFVSHPSPSVVVQNMLGPVFKQYRVLDIRDDGRVVAMTETGDVKQGLPVIDQGGLWNRLNDVFSDGRGSVRVLVINDGGRELAVDYKVVHGSRL